MEKSSRKSSKTMKHEKQPPPPAEHQPVQSVAELPIALVEIKSLSKEILKCLDGEQYITGKTNQIITLTQSSIKAIKLEGLAGLVERCGISEEEKRMVDQAMNYYFNERFSALTVSEQESLKTMIALFEALQVNDKDEQLEALTQQKCRECGCTDDNCRQCIEKSGKPCWWVQPDLCSACAPEGLEESILAKM